MAENVYFLSHGTDTPEKRESTETGETSWRNEYEATMAAELAKHILRQGQYRAEQITILSYYRAQSELIQKKLDSDEDYKNLLKSTNSAVLCVTQVDSFQGEENEVIIVSLVRSNDQNILGFVNIENRLNVAMSRARFGLYMIGNFSMIEEAISSALKAPGANDSKPRRSAAKTRRGYQLWQRVIQLATRRNIISTKLSLKCQTHGNSVLVESAADFTTFKE